MKQTSYNTPDTCALTEALRTLSVGRRLLTPWGPVVCRPAVAGNITLSMSPCRRCALLPFRGGKKLCPLFASCCARHRADGRSVCFEAVDER